MSCFRYGCRQELSTLGDFIITDWGWDFVKEIKYFEDIEHYLRERLEVFSKK